jgi:hypothetical protein
VSEGIGRRAGEPATAWPRVGGRYAIAPSARPPGGIPGASEDARKILRRPDLSWWNSIQWCALGSLGLAVITWPGFRLQFDFAGASLCYLLLIVLQVFDGGLSGLRCCLAGGASLA